MKIRFISLVNLIMDRRVVTELIQNDCKTKNITQELSHVLSAEGRTQMMNDYKELSGKMGTAGASGRTAKLILAYLKS
ncbi:lipid-A-disaccharide synthase [compost metagenome]